MCPNSHSHRLGPKPARTIYLGIAGCTTLLIEMMSTVEGVYKVTTVGLNALQLVLLGTALEVAVFLFEVPTGVVADLYSRRLSVIIGLVVMGAGAVLLGSIPTFAAILLAEVLWGVGYTFTSGADAAWITDEIGESEAARLFLRSTQVRQVGALAGIIAGTALGTIRLTLPFLLAGALFIALAGLLILVMPEHGFTPVRVAEHTTLQRAGHTFRAGMTAVRGRPVLIMILVIVGLFGMASETFDRLWEIHLLKDFTFPLAGRLQPVVWFGIINVGAMVLTFVAAEVVRRRLDINNASAIAGMLAAMTAIRLTALLVFGLAHGFAIAVPAYWTARVLVGLSQPMIVAWLNRGLDPAVRATVLSMRGQVDAIGQIAGGPAFGVLATTVSIRAAFVTVAGILAPAVALLRRAAR